MKEFVNPFDCGPELCKALPRGVLLTTKSGEQVNTMTIGWGTLGIQWGKPIFIAFVRESRFTKSLLDETGEFTVNIPCAQTDPGILGFCGRKSGRDVEKIQALNLTTEPPEVISVPGIRELPLTLECKVIYKQEQDLSAIPPEILTRYYPEADGSRDVHTAYYGEIVSAYRIR